MVEVSYRTDLQSISWLLPELDTSGLLCDMLKCTKSSDRDWFHSSDPLSHSGNLASNSIHVVSPDGWARLNLPSAWKTSVRKLLSAFDAACSARRGRICPENETLSRAVVWLVSWCRPKLSFVRLHGLIWPCMCGVIAWFCAAWMEAACSTFCKVLSVDIVTYTRIMSKQAFLNLSSCSIYSSYLLSQCL